MSQFLPDAKPQERESAKGPEAYLSPDERKALQRSLSFPEDLPPKFKSWLIDFIAVNIPQIPISQIVGFKQFEASADTKSASDATTRSTGSATYVALGGAASPKVSVGTGLYVVFFGAAMKADNVYTIYSAISVAGDTPSDDDSIQVYFSGAAFLPGARAVLRTVSTAGTVEMVHRVTGFTGYLERRWMVVQKYANLP